MPGHRSILCSGKFFSKLQLGAELSGLLSDGSGDLGGAGGVAVVEHKCGELEEERHWQLFDTLGQRWVFPEFSSDGHY